MIFKKKKIQSQQFTESDIEKTFQELDRLNEKFLKKYFKKPIDKWNGRLYNR